MKQSPQLQRVQANMRAGVISREGFLGKDARPLNDILVADTAAVQRLGVSHAAIAARMRMFRDAGVEGLGMGIHVAPHFDVSVDAVRGILPCPFDDHMGLRKVNIAVRNEACEETIAFTDLGIHLIEAHGFYGGRKSPFRNDPADLVRILEVEPDTD